jgi:hypothetical protein
MTYCFESENVLELFTDFDKHKTSAVCSAFSNLLSTATSQMPEEWSLRFTRTLQEAMLAQFLEARYLLEKKDPSLSMYLAHRKTFGYMDASLVYIFTQNDVEILILYNRNYVN